MREGVPGADVRPTVAIIGAGVSGMACARALSPQMKVKLYDKSRGVGGRLSTRYADAYEFDHGAQYFTVRDPGFSTVVDAAVADGAVGEWNGKALYLSSAGVDRDKGGTRYVGTPRMNAFAKWMASGLDIQTGRRVASVTREGGWQLTFEDGSTEAGFSAVVLAVPAPQALVLLPDAFAHRHAVAMAKMDVCFALMVGLRTDMDIGFSTVRAKDLPVDWIAVNSTKPGRPDGGTTLMIHSEAAWSNAHAETDREWVKARMLETASDLLFTDLSAAPHQVLHRWLYSSVAHPAGEACLWDTDMRLGTCGDWCPGGRVEGAWTSGTAMAAKVLESF